MGGFDHTLTLEPTEAKKLILALADFRRYLKAMGKLNEWGADSTGITHYRIFTDENDVMYSTSPGDKDKPVRVKDWCPQHVAEIRKGKWMFFWDEITWLHKIPRSTLFRFKNACEKHGCTQFWNDIARFNNISDMLIDEWMKLDPDVRENRAW